jgi:general secretion pathway protein M
MTNINRIESIVARFPLAGAVLYLVLIAVFVVTAATTVIDLVERREAVAAAADILGQIEGRGPARARATSPGDVTVPVGSPFVEGATVSVAGATLLQRVATAATQVGGNVLSSQVDLQGSQSKAGFVTVTASFEVEPPSLQRVLYDLEAGMPHLFVDQIVVQAPSGSTDAPGSKMRVLLSVSGQWRGAK